MTNSDATKGSPSPRGRARRKPAASAVGDSAAEVGGQVVSLAEQTEDASDAQSAVPAENLAQSETVANPTTSPGVETMSEQVMPESIATPAEQPPVASSALAIQSTVNMAGLRPIATSSVQVVDTVNMAGLRPIIASGLNITHSVNMAGLRPIVDDGLQVLETVNIMGIRPITTSEIQIAETINLMGVRPIAYSGLQITEMMSVAGLRPVASNEIDNSNELMGFLD